VKKVNGYLLVFLVVYVLVLSHTLNVIEFLFRDSDYQNEGERSDVREQESYFQSWDELREADEQEEEVVKHLELVEKYHWY